MNLLPLSGLKVLDLSRILAGPYATQIMGDLGADVIKVEAPSGDDTRSWGPPFIKNGDTQSASYFYSANRNKRSVQANLKNTSDLEYIQNLAQEADVIIENFKLDGLSKYHLDYPSIQKKNPKIIYCSINGFGSTGPDKDLPGYDALIQAMGGLMSVTGTEDQEPVRAGVAITDISTGLYSVIAIQAALIERQRSGQGQHIELSLFETQVSWLANVGMNFLTTGQAPKMHGTAHPNIVPYQAFQTSDHPIYVAVGNDSQFQRLASILGLTTQEQGDYATNSERVERREDLIPRLEGVFKTDTRASWISKLREQGIPIGPINTLQDLRSDPQLNELGTLGTMSDSETPCLKSPMRFSRTKIEEYRTPPAEPSQERIQFKEQP